MDILGGFRIVDLTVDRGELCSRLLADLGADVIKVELPGGSPARSLAPLHGDVSLFWALRNAGKRSVVLEPGDGRLDELLATSDAVVLSDRPGQGHDPDELLARHPHLVVTAITPYGRRSPWAERVTTDGVLASTATIAYKAGLPTREPLLPPASFVDDGTSVAFAFATLCALWQREGSGAGQVLDCSVNEAMANMGDWTLANASAMIGAGMEFPDKRNGAGPVWPSFRCADGYVRVVILAPRQWHAMRAWLGEPDYLQDPELDGMLGRLAIADAVINPLIQELFADKTMAELSAEAQARGIVCTPLAQVSDVLTNEHFHARGTFVELELGPGVHAPLPSGFLEVDGERAGPRCRPPAVGEHTEEVFADLGERQPAPVADPEPALPLVGLRVADFGHGGVGVEVGRMLAEYGADVMKIESRSYPDFIRVQTGAEMSPSFASSSRSKRGFGANAKDPDGRRVLLQLLATTDVVIENNATGVMDKLGLGYRTLREQNAGVVMVSSQLMGSRGPWADFRGYGPSTRAAGGFEMLWNYADLDEPAGGMSIFPDHLCGRLGALGAVAALLARRRRGTGAHVELAQVEVTVGIVGDLIPKEALEPGSVRATGNRRDRGAPWGLFPCSGDDQWVAITCRDDADWARLVEVMGSPAWADAGLATAPERHRRVDDVEKGVASWTRTVTREAAAAACQAAGVPAGEVLTTVESMTHEQFVARGFPVEITQHGNLVPQIILDGPGFFGSRMAPAVIEPAPLVGEHTRDICAELGLPAEEVEELVAKVALEVTPPISP